MARSLLLMLASFTVLSIVAEPTTGTYPVIGVVTQPNEVGWPGNRPYIAASYVKYVESAGARVVPIQFDGSDEYLEVRFALLVITSFFFLIGYTMIGHVWKS